MKEVMLKHKKLIALALVLLGLALSAVVGFAAYEDIAGARAERAAAGR